MKRLFLFLIVLVLAAGMLVGCGNEIATQETDAQISETSSAKVDASAKQQAPSETPVVISTKKPAREQSEEPSAQASETAQKEQDGTAAPSSTPTAKPTAKPKSTKTKTTVRPTAKPATKATAKPTTKPTAKPTKEPEKNTITVSISIDCTTAVNAGYEIAAAIAPSGKILSKKVTLEKGATVFDALKESGAVVGAKSSSMGKYVYSIQSLSEKACGSKSGWIYSVNGSIPNKSCDRYTLKEGDKVRWRYTCDNGRDL